MQSLINKIKDTFLSKKFFSFLIIGVINTLVAQGLYMMFVVMSVAAGLSSILGDVLSVVCSYVLNMKYTYKIKMSWKSFVSFPVSYIPGWIVNALIVVLCVDVLQVNELFAKVFSLPITIPLNFVVMSLLMKFVGKEKE